VPWPCLLALYVCVAFCCLPPLSPCQAAGLDGVLVAHGIAPIGPGDQGRTPSLGIREAPRSRRALDVLAWLEDHAATAAANATATADDAPAVRVVGDNVPSSGARAAAGSAGGGAGGGGGGVGGVRFVVLDDDDLTEAGDGAADALSSHFIRVDRRTGLTDADADAAMALLLNDPGLR